MALSERNGLVVSDLHLGQTGALGSRDLRAVHQHINQHKPELVVLNGDIIEAEWAAGSKEEVLEKIAEATNEVRNLVKATVDANPTAEVLYVFGNHDSCYEVAEALEGVKAEFPNNFTLEEAMAQRGDTLFMHGDLPLGIGKYEGSHVKRFADIVRGKFEFEPGHLTERPHGDGNESYWQHVHGRDGVKKPWTHAITTIAGMSDSVATKITYPFEKVVHAIQATIEQHDAELPEGEKLLDTVNRVAIGHIHPSYDTRMEHKGVEYVASGAATRLNRDTMFQFDITDEGLENFEAKNIRLRGSAAREGNAASR